MLYPVRLSLAIYVAVCAVAMSSTTGDLSTGSILRDHPRDLLLRRAAGCGTWTMYCGGLPPASGSNTRGPSAEDACNNACYYINSINPGFVATYDSSVDNDREHQQSGCTTQQGSVCNKMPFSQRFHDKREEEIYPEDQKFDCDEFPMAGMFQADFNDLPQNTIRNSLRCTNAAENAGEHDIHT